MPFTSLDFGIFFLLFYIVYLVFLKNHRVQNLWLLLGGYFFYASWDWRFLLVLLSLTGANYIIGLGLGWQGRKNARVTVRRLLLGSGLFINLGTLIFFKYAGYFNVGLVRLLSGTGLVVDSVLTDVILPVGLSFYALQASSYIIDVFARRIQPTSNLVELALFIGFFPQLLAGPIERASHMLPQFRRTRHIDPGSFSAGFYLLLSGFFKKLVVADNLGAIANPIFDNYTSYTGVDLLIGGLAFTFQLYADFSAYSDIARGLARFLGFDLLVNFRLPYFAATPAEFWSRWHISLSEWLRDYIFFPIRRALLRWKSRTGRLAGLILPPLVTMLISGIWHGTGINFIIWGFYHGLLMILFQLLGADKSSRSINRDNNERNIKLRYVITWLWLRLGFGLRILFMFFLIALGWLIFRVQSLGQLGYFLTNLSFEASLGSTEMWANLILFSLPLFAVQVIQQARGELLSLARFPILVRLVFYGAALALMVALGVRESSEFIYVQF